MVGSCEAVVEFFFFLGSVPSLVLEDDEFLRCQPVNISAVLPAVLSSNWSKLEEFRLRYSLTDKCP